MDIARCFERCAPLGNLIEVKTIELLWSALDAGETPTADALRRAADWGDHLSALIPDLDEHLWRHPLADLGEARALASLCAALRPLLDGDRDGASRAIAAVDVTVTRDAAAAPEWRRQKLRSWLDKARAVSARAA